MDVLAHKILPRNCTTAQPWGIYSTFPWCSHSSKDILLSSWRLLRSFGEIWNLGCLFTAHLQVSIQFSNHFKHPRDVLHRSNLYNFFRVCSFIAWRMSSYLRASAVLNFDSPLVRSKSWQVGKQDLRDVILRRHQRCSQIQDETWFWTWVEQFMSPSALVLKKEGSWSLQGFESSVVHYHNRTVARRVGLRILI